MKTAANGVLNRKPEIQIHRYKGARIADFGYDTALCLVYSNFCVNKISQE